jgi:alpha-tubulin suppressor-like RCC1 family protein
VTGSGTHAIAAGNAHTCAITPGGGVQCWGDNSHGQLGDGSKTGSSSPVDVKGLAGVASIAAGGDHTCALSGSDIWCWGRNDHGQAGDGTTTDRLEPVKVLSGAVDLTAGFDFTCAVLSGGQAMCWGANDHGQLADGTTKDHSRPALARLLTGVFNLDAGQADTCGITATGVLRCVIAGQAQQLSGFPAPSLELAVNRFGSGALGLDTNGVPYIQSGGGFQKVPGVTDALDLDSGQSYICALLGDGTVKCWGSNTHGELGDNSTQSSSTPQLVSGLTGAWQLAVGRSHACAMLQSSNPAVNNIRCWGLNDKGQLGSGDYKDSTVPVPVK